jgi:aminoglycoside 6'-N-acetyltransferase I
MRIVDLSGEAAAMRYQAAALLVDAFDTPAGWPTLDLARGEVARVIAEGFARGAIEGDVLRGWIGGLPEYHGHVWELHPLVVQQGHRREGIGRALVAAFEAECVRRGALTVTLGTDDDSEMTSLSNVNLYEGLPRHLSDLRDLGRGHPFLFYRKLGYVVTGVMPDANGIGRPDIFMSKPVRR